MGGKKGGGGGDVYRSPNLGGYENASYGGIMNRLGAGANNTGGGMYNYSGTPSYSNPNQSYAGQSYGPNNNKLPSGIKVSSVAPGQVDPSTGQMNTNGLSLQGGGGGPAAKIFGSLLGAGVGSAFGMPGLGYSLGSGLGSISSRNNAGNSGDPSQGNYNLSQIGSPLGGKAGIDVATSGYNFNPQNQAISGLSKMAGNYNPYQFNFQNLPEQYTKEAYQQGASDIAKQGANTTGQLQESIGTRRPGLLMKAAEDTQRGTNQNLNQLRTSLDLNRINQNVETQKAQQQAQAQENQGAQNINSGTLQNLFNAGQGLVGTQSGLLQNERGYQDQALQFLMDMYKSATGQANQAAQIGNQAQNSSMNMIGGLAQGASKIPWGSIF